MQNPRTVAEVLAQVHTTWAELLDTIDGLSEAQLIEPGPDGWSMKDHLAHIMAWDSVPVTILRGQPQHRAFGLDEAAYDRIDSVDQLNALIYDRHKDMPPAEVRASLERVHAELVSALQHLSDADLDRAVAEFSGDVEDTRPMREKIEGDSYGHYAEHRAWLAELRSVLFEQIG